MNVRFIAPNPRERARPVLDRVLSGGTEQLASACAFLTPGGVEMLRPHAGRLTLPGSFVVVAWQLPTTLESLNLLYDLIPGHLYVHLGSETPYEKGVGAGLMHSKVFFAKAGDQCQLWTGSHNLTASAMQGVNCEAAVLLEGSFTETPFQEALAHLNHCRSEAMLFDPLNPPPPLVPNQTLVIHAECHTALKSAPWFVHLRPDNTDYDKAMRPPAEVWLYLYNPGTLQPGRRRPPAIAAYSGTLTALGFTEHHPRNPGITGAWDDADYVIEFRRGVPCLLEHTRGTNTPSQGVFKVAKTEDHHTVWLSEPPAPKLERVPGVEHFSRVDAEFRQFFTKKSLRGPALLRHQPYRSLKTVMRVPRKEAGSVEAPDLLTRLETQTPALADKTVPTEIIIDETLEEKDIFAFVYRAKYRA